MAACAIALAAGAILAGAAPAMAENPPSLLLMWGSLGSGSGQLDSSEGVATDSSGNVYVADRYNNRVQEFSPTGAFLRMWGFGVDNGTAVFQTCTPATLPCQAGLSGSGNGQFYWPRGVATDSSNNVYVADVLNNRVQKFTSSGAFLGKWGTFGSGAGQLYWPTGIAVDSSGNVYVSEQSNRRVQKFSPAGTFAAAWGWDVKVGGGTGFEICTPATLPCQAGSYGSGDGQFKFPEGVATDSIGNVYVIDASNDRIQKFTSSGTFLDKWGSTGTGDGQFYSPHGVATDSSNNVYVADTANGRVQKFSSSGAFLTKWGLMRTDNGQFDWSEGVATDSFGNVYVVGSYSGHVEKFGPAPVFSVAPTIKGFGDQPIAAGPTAAQTFTVTNAGTANLVIGAVDLTGGEADQFQITANSCASQTLAPSSSCAVSATFEPATTGLKQTSLRFNHNATGSPTDVALQGTGTDPNALAGPEVIGAKRKTTVGKGAKFSVDVTCPAGRTEACQGKLEANAKASKKKKKKVRAQAKGKTVVVSSARYSVSPGAKSKVRMKLNKAGSRMLRTSRPRNKLPVTLTATGSVAGNPAIASANTVLALKGKRIKGK